MNLSQLQVIDANTVVVGGGCTLRRSEDGGKVFTRLPFTASESSCSTPLSAMWFTAPKIGYLVLSDGTVLRTDDGGLTFSRKTAVPGTGAPAGPRPRPRSASRPPTSASRSPTPARPRHRAGLSHH